MGTDIHLSAEVKNPETGAWEFLPGPTIECWSCDGTGIAQRYERPAEGGPSIRVNQTDDEGNPRPCSYCTNDGTTSEYDGTEDGESDRAYYRRRYVGVGFTRDTWYSDRSYVAFAILGNVRNGHGFAGIETHVPLPFISDNRGVPDDATPETLDILSNEHSETWCTLDEVLSYDFDQPIHQSGVIGLDVYAKLREGNKAPDSWSGGISGQGVVTVTEQAADALLAQLPIGELTSGDDTGVAGALSSAPHTTRTDNAVDMMFGGRGQEIGGTRYYVRYHWTDKLTEYTEGLRARMDMLREAAAGRECRLIFDFDS